MRPARWLVQPRPWPSQNTGIRSWALARLLTLRSCRKIRSDRSRLVAAVLRSFADLTSLKARHSWSWRLQDVQCRVQSICEETWEDTDTSLCLYVSQDVWKPLLGQRPLLMERFSVFRISPCHMHRAAWGLFRGSSKSVLQSPRWCGA